MENTLTQKETRVMTVIISKEILLMNIPAVIDFSPVMIHRFSMRKGWFQCWNNNQKLAMEAINRKALPRIPGIRECR
jgi:hypothetical protein